MEAISIAELESEQAELLPPREVMWCYRSSGSHTDNHAVVVNGSGDGNTEQEGLVNVSALNGNFDGDGNLTGIFQR